MDHGSIIYPSSALSIDAGANVMILKYIFAQNLAKKLDVFCSKYWYSCFFKEMC
jgi:hypothetical protein